MIRKAIRLFMHSNHAFRSAAGRLRQGLGLSGQRRDLAASEEKTLDSDMRMLDSWFSEL